MTEEEIETQRNLKIEKIQGVLGDLKTGLTFFQSQIDKVEKALEELKSITNEDETIKPEVDIKQNSLSAETSKRIPTVRRVDSEEEKRETSSPYNIQVVGLGTTKIDF
jgi:hypothetical protein